MVYNERIAEMQVKVNADRTILNMTRVLFIVLSI